MLSDVTGVAEHNHIRIPPSISLVFESCAFSFASPKTSALTCDRHATSRRSPACRASRGWGRRLHGDIFEDAVETIRDTRLVAGLAGDEARRQEALRAGRLLVRRR